MLVPSEEGLTQAFDYADIPKHRPWRHKWDPRFASIEQLAVTRQGPYSHLAFHRTRMDRDQIFTNSMALVSTKSKVVEDHDRIELVRQSIAILLDSTNRENDHEIKSQTPLTPRTTPSPPTAVSPDKPQNMVPDYRDSSIQALKNRESHTDDITRLLNCYIHDSTLGEDFRKSIVSLIGLNTSENSNPTSAPKRTRFIEPVASETATVSEKAVSKFAIREAFTNESATSESIIGETTSNKTLSNKQRSKEESKVKEIRRKFRLIGWPPQAFGRHRRAVLTTAFKPIPPTRSRTQSDAFD